MAFQIFASNTVGAGFQANLGSTDSAFVSAGVTVGSTTTWAVAGTGSLHSVEVQGTVVGHLGVVLGSLNSFNNSLEF